MNTNLIGQTVNHNSWGKGTIQNVDAEGRIEVAFSSCTKQLSYLETVGKGFMTFDDSNIQNQAIEEWKQRENAKKAESAAKAEASVRRQEESKKKGTSDKKEYVPDPRVDGKPKTFLVFQESTFSEEANGHFIWAPKYCEDGSTRYWFDTLMEAREGDAIIHVQKRNIKAISKVKGSCVDFERPEYNKKVDKDKLWLNEGRKVECDYTILKKAIKIDDFKDELIKNSQEEFSPFDKNGKAKQGSYLFVLSPDLAATFMNAVVEKNEDIRDLDYIQWLIG